MEYTKEGIEKLYNHACGMVGGCKYEIKYLYRNKSSYYFEDIITNKDGVMLPYLKDNGNDQLNPMNGRLGGLFFSADHDYSLYYQSPSYFGNTRLTIPANRLLDGKNFYFADFYCLQGKCHYINIVVCTPNSKSDQFCEQKLFKLSRNDNGFLVNENGVYKVKDAMYLKVEIFITDAVNIKEELKASNQAFVYSGVSLAGKGSSKKGGLAKKRDCSTCNIPDRSNHTQSKSQQRVIEEMKFEAEKTKSFSFSGEGKYIFDPEPKEDSWWIIKEGSKGI